MILLVGCMLTITANAQSIMPYASDQLGAYDSNVAATGNGKLAIQFSVEGTGIMKKIGSSEIIIYEKYGKDGWMIVGAFTEKDKGMTTSGQNSYGTTMYFSGTSGKEYKVSVTIFATDYDGVTDSRTITNYITA
jgi:hypothetical protein